MSAESTHSDVGDGFNRELTRTERQIDLLLDQMVDLSSIVKEIAGSRGNTQTIIHKTQGMGNWGAAAVTACFCTLIFMVLAAIVVIPDLHDLRAWQDINRKDIARIQAFIQQEKQK